MRLSPSLHLFLLVLLLTACDSLPTPDKLAGTKQHEAWKATAIKSANGDYVRFPEHCPSLTNPAETHPLSNNQLEPLGCFNARNLALMVHNPQDLAGGRNVGPADAVAAVRAVNTYREGKVAPLIETKTTK
ncbi:MAG: CpaD family pilus assembly lipoprotein [Alphaproteobacteria bacterium]